MCKTYAAETHRAPVSRLNTPRRPKPDLALFSLVATELNRLQLLRIKPARSRLIRAIC